MNCPDCGKLVPPEYSVCECGFLLIGNLLKQQNETSTEFEGQRRRHALIKALTIGAFSLTFLAFLGYFVGVIGPAKADNSEQENEAVSHAGPALSKSAELVSEFIPTKPFDGKVTSVRTGDVLLVEDNLARTFLVKVAGVKSPKLNEPFGIEAKEWLTGRILNQRVQVIPYYLDENKNLISEVFHDQLSIASLQLQNGLAVYDEDSSQGHVDEKIRQLIDAESAAKSNRHGVWSKQSPDSIGIAAADISVQQPNATRYDPARTQTHRPSNSEFGDRSSQQSSAPSEVSSSNSSAQPQQHPNPPPTAPPAVTLKQTSVSHKQSSDVKTEVSSTSPAPENSNYVRIYTLGPRGGCYYLTPQGKKSYVDKSKCS